MNFKNYRINVYDIGMDSPYGRWAWQIQRQALNNRWVNQESGLQESESEARAAAERIISSHRN